MPIALVSDIHGNDRALGALYVNPGSVGVSVSFMRVPWNGR